MDVEMLEGPADRKKRGEEVKGGRVSEDKRMRRLEQQGRLGFCSKRGQLAEKKWPVSAALSIIRRESQNEGTNQ